MAIDPVYEQNKKDLERIRASGDISGVFRYTPPPAPAPPATSTVAPTAPTVNPIEQYYKDPLKAGGYYEAPPGVATVPGGFYQNPDGSFVSADPAVRAKEAARRDFQGYIDVINQRFNAEVSQENTMGEDRLGRQRALSSRSGTFDSPIGQTQRTQVQDYNKQRVDAINAERNMMLSEVYGKIDTRAREEIAAKKAEALGNSERYLQYLEKNQKAAREDFITVAKSGAMIEPGQKAKLLQQAGYDPEFGELLFNAYKPSAEKIDYQYIERADGSVLAIGQDPTTGELKQQVIPGATPDLAIVVDMIKAYPDAGILPTDDVGAASAKIQNSKLYKESIRPPSSGVKTTQTERLLADQQTIITKAQTDLDQERATSKDGKANPNTYRKFKTQYIAAGGTPADFFQSFPIEVYISPENRVGDLTGTALEIKVGETQDKDARLAEIYQKSNNGEDLSKLSLLELIEFQNLTK